MKYRISSILGDLLALISGAALTFAFAPARLYLLGLLSPAILLALWLTVSPRRAFLRGWLYGVGLFGSGVSWVFISIHTFGNAPVSTAATLTGAFIAILALFPALTGYILQRSFPKNNNTKVLCAFPAIWVLLEWMRSWLFTGFPWLFIGYTQTAAPLRGFAAIFSVYGVSLATLVSSALIINTIFYAKQRTYRAAYFNLLALAAIWIIGACLNTISWTHPKGTPIQVSLVQGNIPQEIKWSPENIQPTLDRYVALTKPHWDSKIIVWPEAAVPVPLPEATDFMLTMLKTAKQHQATLITGIPIRSTEGSGYYNAIIAVGNGNGIYLKRLLVPFGEFTPMRSVLKGFMNQFNIPMSDMVPGKGEVEPLNASGNKIAAFICYEILFPERVLLYANNVDMLLAVSNDAWFGRSFAQAQHLQMAQMRAIEVGRPVLFGSNDGITALIDATGKIQSAAPPYESFVLTGLVQAMQGRTPWQRFGMDPVLAVILIFMIIAKRTQKKS